MCMSSPKAPAMPPPPPPPPAPPRRVDEGTQAARQSDSRKRRASGGRAGTILTGPLGLADDESTGAKKLGG